jgi:hypothetical protein
VSTPDQPERLVVAAAVLVSFNGYELVFSVPRPGRHSDVVSAMNTMGAGAYTEKAEQGFLLSDGRFANRRQARRIAQCADQIIKPLLGDGSQLYSDNVW